jgi:phosphoribosyl-AMP cyclohydrolase
MTDDDTSARLPDELEAVLAFDAAGLIPAIAQQHDSGEVLMMAWMNRAAIAETLATGRVCYWSRSRGRLWRKGETSGQVQRLVELSPDCDRAWRAGGLEETQAVQVDPGTLYGKDR